MLWGPQRQKRNRSLVDALESFRKRQKSEGLPFLACSELLPGTIKLETIGQPQSFGVALERRNKMLEADLPEVLVRSVANPRSLLTLVLVSFYDNFALWT